MLYWLLKSVLLGPLMRALFRPDVSGLDNVPAEGPAILASNHLSFSDSFFLPLVVPRRITFLAKSDYFTGPGLKGWLTAGFFRGVGQVPIDRTGGSASEGAITAGLRVLSSGNVLGIYPEGTRSPDGRLYRGRTGVARMALEARCPVLPVAMVGTDKVQPTGQKIPNLGKVGIVIGEPMDFSRYAGLADDRTVLRSITDEIMYELMRLSGQEYVDEYASTVKEQLAEAVRERITHARERAQAAAASASARAAEARVRVEEARAKVDATVEGTRARMDATIEGARARVDATVGDALSRRAKPADEGAPQTSAPETPDDPGQTGQPEQRKQPEQPDHPERPDHPEQIEQADKHSRPAPEGGASS